MKFVGFDIEIARTIPDGEDWHNHRRLGITCASLVSDDRTEMFWAGNSLGRYDPFMSVREVDHLVARMNDLQNSGYTITTWNGMGFDFQVLTDESYLPILCKTLAANHVDMMFQVLCTLGYPLGLDKVAKEMGLPGKPEGMSGALAPVMWREGKYQEVIDYVIQDSRTTLELAKIITEQGNLRWKSTKGYHNTLMMPGGWMTVNKCLEIPEPDTSWMSKPWKRSDFLEWME